MNDAANVSVEDLSEPLTLSLEPYLSEEYAKAEGSKLWAKVWQSLKKKQTDSLK